MKVGSQSIPPSYLRLSMTLSIMLMVISSPIIMLVDPSLLAASPGAADDVTTYAPSTISQGGSDFTAQAPLLGPATFRSTDLVSSTAIYEIQFITTTTGVIDKIDVTFPPGTGVALAGIIERVGITGPATITKSGPTVTLDLNTPVSVPAGTFVRLEMVDLINPPNPANYKISVTTKNPSNVPIDGPSLSPAYTIRQVSTGMIANDAVTTGKIANGAIAPFVIERPSASNPVSVPPNDFSPVTSASCLAGEQAVGGGFFTFGSAARFLRLSESTLGFNAWKVQMVNEDTVDAHSFGVVVECMPALP